MIGNNPTQPPGPEALLAFANDLEERIHDRKGRATDLDVVRLARLTAAALGETMPPAGQTTKETTNP